jgi:uncharacterized protein YjbI with pentapeptide repeats
VVDGDTLSAANGARNLPRPAASFMIADMVRAHELWIGTKGQEGKRFEVAGLDLAGLELPGVDLGGAVMTNCVLAGARLAGAILTVVDLTNPDKGFSRD